MQDLINAAWEDRSLLKDAKTVEAIEAVIQQIDEGKLRCAEPTENGWQVNEWVKKKPVFRAHTRLQCFIVKNFKYLYTIRLKVDMGKVCII